MNAKQRYRRREALRSALGRVMDLLTESRDDGIVPDEQTARMAVRVALALSQFALSAGIELNGSTPLRPFIRVKNNRKKDTEYRQGKRAKRKGTQP
jgi:hypothetical protein